MFTQDANAETAINEQLFINNADPFPFNIISYQSDFETLLPLYTADQHRRISARIGYCDLNSTPALFRKSVSNKDSNDSIHIEQSGQNRVDIELMENSSRETSTENLNKTPIILWHDEIDPPQINPQIRLIGASFSAPKIEPYLEANITMAFLDKVAEFENNLQKQNFLPSQDPALKMKSYANRLKRLNASKILVHKRWTQLVPERTNPQPIYIQAGKFLKNSYELEGTISLSARRFLHFEANLIYQDPKQRPDLNAIDSEGFDLAVSPHMLMSETRRMRSSETHYLDHPKFGVIVRVDPIDFSEELVSLFQDLQESQQ